jgi:hypothetical protein
VRNRFGVKGHLGSFPVHDKMESNGQNQLYLSLLMNEPDHHWYTNATLGVEGAYGGFDPKGQSSGSKGQIFNTGRFSSNFTGMILVTFDSL